MAATPALTPPTEDFPRWYQDVVAKAELAENGPVRGTMVLRPYGFAIWERIQSALDSEIKALDVQGAYFPLFIPESYLAKEAEHVEGFSPELAVVTHAGGEELSEPLVVRPTSETVIGEFMAKWIQSYRDLPLKLNQWANVVRWELRPRILLRTTEFLWQEGHTAHATMAEAKAFAQQVHHEVYHRTLEETVALPSALGIKSARERFAGAVNSMTAEGLMGDGKALQLATSHELGQNFSRAFDIAFQNEAGQSTLCYTTSWGTSTRLLGALVMAHGDAKGLVVPPRLAPTQVVVLAVNDDDAVAAACDKVVSALRGAGVRVTKDAGRGSFGRRVTNWEIKGVPLRVEVGPRDLADGNATLARRDTGEKQSVSLDTLAESVPHRLEMIHASILASAQSRLANATVECSTVDDALDAAATGFARIPWSTLGAAGEARLAEQAITVRCLQRPDGTLPDGDHEADLMAVVARSY